MVLEEWSQVLLLAFWPSRWTILLAVQGARPDPDRHQSSCSSCIIAYGAIHYGMIKTFRDKETENLFNRKPVKHFREIERSARRKLEMVDAAEILDNLRFPPGNRLEALKGNRSGQYSIRINDQYRVCFVRGDDNNAYDVEACDYH
jgi:toxin HigB-1